MRELYNHPKASLLHLKTRMVKFEVVEALLYGCASWTLLICHYNTLRTACHRMLLQILDAWYNSPTKTPSSELQVRTLRQPCARGGCCGWGRCSAWVSTGYSRGSSRESWRARDNVGRTAWKRIVGYLGGAGVPRTRPWGLVQHKMQGGCIFMAAWVREEEKTTERRRRKREGEAADKVEVASGVTVGSVIRSRAALIGPTQGLRSDICCAKRDA